MTDATKSIVRAALAGDPSLTADARTKLLAILDRPTNADDCPDRLLTFTEASKMLGLTTRSVRALADSGALDRVRLPGRVRARHVRLRDVRRLMEGGVK